MPYLSPLPTGFVSTRASLHLVAVRILATARFGSSGHMGLVPVPGGFGIPPSEGPAWATVDGQLTDGVQRWPLTTLAAAAEVVGVDLAAPPHPALDVPADPDAALTVDEDSAAVLGDWYGFAQELLEAVTATAEPADAPSPIQLWPEHFDLAMELGPPRSRANFGASPGDGAYPEPYLYVGPHERRHEAFWNAPFGAVLTYAELLDGNDPQAFLQHGRDMLRPQ